MAALCNCRGGVNCCMLQNGNRLNDFQYPSPMKTSTGSVITIYLRTEDERQISAIAEAVADTLDIAAGRPQTAEDIVPYIVTVGPVEMPEDPLEFIKAASKGKTDIIVPHPISDDET